MRDIQHLQHLFRHGMIYVDMNIEGGSMNGFAPLGYMMKRERPFTYIHLLSTHEIYDLWSWRLEKME